MSFAIQSSRSLLRSALFPRIAYTFAAPFATRTRTLSAVGVGLGLIGDILSEMILRAVPKQRTSHSKKRKRMAGKGLKNRQDLVPCTGCGRPKMIAHICMNCYHDIKKKLKGMKRAEERLKQEQ